MKSRKLLAGFLVMILFAVSVAQTAFAVEPTLPVTGGVVTGDINVTKPFSNDGVTGVQPTAGDVELNGNLTITMQESGGDAPLTPPRVIGVDNESTGNDVETKNIVINAPTGSIGIGVIEDGGETVVDGNITASTYGIEYNDDYGSGETAGRVICTGTVKGGTAAFNLADGAELPADAIVVYQLEEGSNGLVTVNGNKDVNDAILSSINYIIKKNDRFGAISIKDGDTTKIGDYDTAHAGDVLTIKMAVGYTLGGTVTVTPNADGSYTVIVPRGGCVTLDAILRQIANGGGSSVVVAGTQTYTQGELNQLGNNLGAYVINEPADLTLEVCEKNKKLVFTEAALKSTDFVNQYSFLLTNSEYTIYGVSNDGNVTETTNDSKGITTVSKGPMGEIGKQEREGSGENSEPADNHVPTESGVKVNEETKKAIAEAQAKASEYYGNDNTNVKVNFKVERENENDNAAAIDTRTVKTALSEGNVYSDKCSAILPNKSLISILGDDQQLTLGAGGQIFEIPKDALEPSGGAASVSVMPEPSGIVKCQFDFVGKVQDVKVFRVHAGVSQFSTLEQDGEFVTMNTNAGIITVTAKKH